MERRHFLKKATLTATAGLFSTGAIKANEPKSSAAPFHMKFAPHIGMFKHHAGDDPIDQLKFMADQGFTAFEDNQLKRREPDLQKKMGETMAQLGLEMGVFVAHTEGSRDAILAGGDPEKLEKFLMEIKECAEVAKRVNATWMTVVPGRLDHRLDIGYQTANVVEALRQASAILEPHGLVMVLEPLNFFNHPQQFLTKIPQAYQICRAVDSPACKILFDMYHQQIQEGNIIPNIDKSWEEIGYFQIGDNPGRKEPTTGEMNYKNIFRHIHEKGFTGILGMEHGNAQAGEEGERALIEAYRSVDVSG